LIKSLKCNVIFFKIIYYYIGLLKGKVFFVAKFCHIATKKGVTTCKKDFLEKIPHIHHILKAEKVEIASFK
jgi:hypothetical protein